MNEQQVVHLLVSIGITGIVTAVLSQLVNAKVAALISPAVLKVTHSLLDERVSERIIAALGPD